MDEAAGPDVSDGVAPALDLFGKTELWVMGISLNGTDLSLLAAAAADALSQPRDKLFVTDVRNDHVVFDVMVDSVEMDSLVGQQAALLAALAAVDGVRLHDGAAVHSHGVLGIVGTPPEQAGDVLAAATRLDANLRAYVARRIAVISTGAEVARGEIIDTNCAAVSEIMGAAGYIVESGGVVDDDEVAIAGRVARMAEDGFGIIITTGGVGAEDKDRTIEAIQRIADEVATAVLMHYEVGHGRHVKPHVRVACGLLSGTLIIALPGPTREVRAALPNLIKSLENKDNIAEVAEAMATPIRALWTHHQSQKLALSGHPPKPAH